MPERTEVTLRQICDLCDRWFEPASQEDWPGAWNGLQVENSGRVRRLAAAVDARRATVEAAAAVGADLLLVHHGLFWSPTTPWTGAIRRLQRLLLENDMAVYSLHLPLDEHPRFGNNALLFRALGFRKRQRFFMTKGRKIGFQAHQTIRRDVLGQRLAKVTGTKPILLPGGPATCRRVGIVTGGAGAELKQASLEGVDTLITGEGPHWTHAMADDLGLNVFYAGHYATEVFGVQALAAALGRRFGLPWLFLDCPTGL